MSEQLIINTNNMENMKYKLPVRATLNKALAQQGFCFSYQIVKVNLYFYEMQNVISKEEVLYLVVPQKVTFSLGNKN